MPPNTTTPRVCSPTSHARNACYTRPGFFSLRPSSARANTRAFCYGDSQGEDGAELVAFVVSLNDKRRHLAASQRAAVGAD